MIIDCISDLHGHYPELEGGDLLIVAGDLTAGDKTEQYEQFFTWLCMQDHYRKKILIAGNHDNGLLETHPKKIENGIYHNFECCEYLCDSGTEFEVLKIWGSPWTKRFEGMNPDCMAFTCETDDELLEKWAMIPEDTDILVTHSPPYGLMDAVHNYMEGRIESVGSKSLSAALRRIRPKLHVFGHIHEGYGIWRPNLDFINCPGYPIYVNASRVNERYEPVNGPIRVIL